MTAKKEGGACAAAHSQNFRTDPSDSIPEIAPSNKIARPRYVITLTPGAGADVIRGLRWLLKTAKRRFGLIAIDAFEDRGSPLPISNKTADEFRELRDEVIAERAHAWRKP